MKPRLARSWLKLSWNSCSSCFYLWNTGLTDLYITTLPYSGVGSNPWTSGTPVLQWCWGAIPGPRVCQSCTLPLSPAREHTDVSGELLRCPTLLSLSLRIHLQNFKSGRHILLHYHPSNPVNRTHTQTAGKHPPPES